MAILFIRHGISKFNQKFDGENDPNIIDAELTDEGTRRLENKAKSLDLSYYKLALVSPYVRTLQTASILFSQKNIERRVFPSLRERFYMSCDVGSDPSVLSKRFTDMDFSKLRAFWWCCSDSPENRHSVESKELRADFYERMGALSHELTILHARFGEFVAVTHSGVINAITGHDLAPGEHVEWHP